MDRNSGLARPCCIVALILGTLGILPGLREACAQTPPVDETQPLGPIRQPSLATALTLSTVEPAPSFEVLSRYRDFATRFEANFGRSGQARDGTADPLAFLHNSLLARYGGVALHEWVQRGLFLYTRFKGYTELEHRGFAMEVDVDDMSEGKLGVRVNRALE